MPTAPGRPLFQWIQTLKIAPLSSNPDAGQGPVPNHPEQSMYAVIRSGGKQYKVKEGDVIRVEKLDAPEGETISLTDVLMVGEGDSVTVGTPLVEGASVKATVKAHGRGEKIRIIKKRRRKHYRKQGGHRQSFTELTIAGIQAK
jgi:large subunit ribosomal protein L21